MNGDKNDVKYRAYILALKTITFVDSLNKKDLVSQILLKQLIRSTTSIGANVVEAQAGSSTKDFINFLSYALKSANESKFWFCLLRDSKKAPKNTVGPLLLETTDLAKMLASSIITLRKKNK